MQVLFRPICGARVLGIVYIFADGLVSLVYLNKTKSIITAVFKVAHCVLFKKKNICIVLTLLCFGVGPEAQSVF